MKKLWNVLVLTFAINFVALAGSLAWVMRAGSVDRQKLLAIREIVFPPATRPATQPAVAATTRPTSKLDELLAQAAGRPPAEQLEYIRRTFDSESAQVERRYRELIALKTQVDAAQAQLKLDREALAVQVKKLESAKKEADAVAAEKGFQDSLAQYQNLPAKQVKAVFMGLDDATVIQYLTAMEPKAASKITREFKSPEETERLRKIMEKMRLTAASAKE